MCKALGPAEAWVLRALSLLFFGFSSLASTFCAPRPLGRWFSALGSLCDPGLLDGVLSSGVSLCTCSPVLKHVGLEEVIRASFKAWMPNERV